MAIERARKHLQQWNRDRDILEFDVSSATVELAAAALDCEPARIAKTLSFASPQGPILIVAAGDARMDSRKFKDAFGFKARMLERDAVPEQIGHDVGGVCPFGINSNVRVFLDRSLKRFSSVYPACGSSNSAIKLTCEELEIYSGSQQWIDVCKARQ